MKLSESHVLRPHDDTGYLKICGECAERFDHDVRMVGCERIVYIEDCHKCRGKKKRAKDLGVPQLFRLGYHSRKKL